MVQEGKSNKMKTDQVRWTVKSFEFNDTEIISKSKPVEWLGQKSDCYEHEVNGYYVGNSSEMLGSRKKFFFLKKKLEHCEY